MKIYNIPSFSINKNRSYNLNFKGDANRPTYDPKAEIERMENVNRLFLAVTLPEDYSFVYTAESSRKQAQVIAGDFLLKELKGGKINSLCDLGCGRGLPTKVLVDAFEIPVENVVGVDIGCSNFSLGKTHFVYEDMFEYLKRTEKQFDMISLCRPAGLIRKDVTQLLASVKDRLSDKGCFFTYGENSQMREVREVCKKKGIAYKCKEYDFENMMYDSSGHNIEAILIPKSELTKAFQ